MAHRDFASRIHVRNASERGQTRTDVNDPERTPSTRRGFVLDLRPPASGVLEWRVSSTRPQQGGLSGEKFRTLRHCRSCFAGAVRRLSPFCSAGTDEHAGPERTRRSAEARSLRRHIE